MARRSEAAAAPGGTPFENPADWLDVNARLVEGWVQWQGALWQSWIDMQAEWVRQWQAQTSEMPSWLGAYSGAEQLA